MSNDNIVAMYMTAFPKNGLGLVDTWSPPVLISTPAATEAEDDLSEIIAAVDEYVVGKTITEDIMRLREKVAIARDRQLRRMAK
jgi:hypothetical protein